MKEIVIFDVKYIELDEGKEKEPDWESLGVKPPVKDVKEHVWKRKTFLKLDISNVTHIDESTTLLTTYGMSNFIVKGKFDEIVDSLYKTKETKKNKKKQVKK